MHHGNAMEVGPGEMPMRMLIGREYWRQSTPASSKLGSNEIRRCIAAVAKFQMDPWHPGLNFERLGSRPDQNHWSIRASRELRVILAVELTDGRPTRFAAVNMGHHDPVYDWSRRQDARTNLDDCVQVGELDPATNPDADSLPAGEFEEWMLFLPQDHRSLVRRYHKGPARVRGAAGTGKTVIALHRAATLGRRYADSRILVTTFSRSLCNHIATLFQRIPDSPGNVDFVNVDLLAAQQLDDPHWIDSSKVEEAFDSAFASVVPEGARDRLGKQYLREEIGRVIKGRAASREEYLDAGRFDRLGRLRSLKKRDREICWALKEEWDRRMADIDTVSFEDRLIEARDLAWKRKSPKYRAAIIDEGQDLTLVGVQLVRALVAGPPEADLPIDGLMVFDDSAQRIYAGGFRPKWAGLDYTGNSKTIHTNYRNSKAIFAAARAVRGETVVGKDDNDDGAAIDVQFDRAKGERPRLVISRSGESQAILSRGQQLLDAGGIEPEEVGVFAHHNDEASRIESYLSEHGVPCVNLKQLASGPLGPGVRVGTFDRAKGLEFRVVFIAGLGGSDFPLRPTEIEAVQRIGLPSESPASKATYDQIRELRQLRLDRLYAAMTRARDLLFLVADHDPCPEIEAAAGYFECSRN